MSYQKEKNLQAAVKKAIMFKYGERVYYMHPRSKVQKDLLDIYLCFFGLFIVIELKRNLNVKGPTKIQKYHLQKITKAGGLSLCTDSVEKVMDYLEKIKPSFY